MLIKSQFILLLAFSLFFVGCSKEAKHSIRIKNNTSAPISEAKIKEIDFGTVAVGATTEYKLIGEVNNENFTAKYDSLYQFIIQVDIDKKGESKWSITLNNIDPVSGDINATFEED